MLHGHGIRERGVRGPADPGEPPAERTVLLRRYVCLGCDAVIVVGPQGLERGWLFSGPAMVWALWLWGVAKHTAAKVRSQVSPWALVGATASMTWATLRRWARAVRDGRLFTCVRPCPADWSLRQVAARAATTLVALAFPADRSLPQDHQAWRGALNVERAITM
jgi:predicted alpha/beta hydrolase